MALTPADDCGICGAAAPGDSGGTRRYQAAPNDSGGTRRHRGKRMLEFLDGQAKTQLVYDSRSELTFERLSMWFLRICTDLSEPRAKGSREPAGSSTKIRWSRHCPVVNGGSVFARCSLEQRGVHEDFSFGPGKEYCPATVSSVLIVSLVFSTDTLCCTSTRFFSNLSFDRTYSRDSGRVTRKIPFFESTPRPTSRHDAPRRTAPHHTAPHRAAPHHTAPHHTAPHRTAPHRIASHRTAPHRTALHRVAPYHIENFKIGITRDLRSKRLYIKSLCRVSPHSSFNSVFRAALHRIPLFRLSRAFAARDICVWIFPLRLFPTWCHRID